MTCVRLAAKTLRLLEGIQNSAEQCLPSSQFELFRALIGSLSRQIYRIPLYGLLMHPA